MLILFTIYLILAFFSIVIFCMSSFNENNLVLKFIKNPSIVVLICMGVIFFICVLDVFHLIDLRGLSSLILPCEIVGLMSLASCKYKPLEKLKDLSRFLLRTVTICFLIEILIFNINSLHIISDNYVMKQLDLSTATVQNYNVSDFKNETAGEASIEFTNLDMNIGTLTIVGQSDISSNSNFNISITDESNSASYRSNIARLQTIRNNSRSQTIPCNFSGKVDKLKIMFYPSENEVINVTQILINKPIEFKFSIIRFLIMLIGSFSIYILSSKQFLFKNYSESKKMVNIGAWIITSVLILSSLFIVNMGRYVNENHSLENDFNLTYGNQISQGIVEAFESGRTDMDIPINEELIALDNPYDWSQRKDIGAYPWDHLLYNNKYYSYYGIGPVLTLFLPYHLITGKYFPSCWAIWLYGVLGIYFLTKFYLCFIQKFFKDTKGSLVLLGLAIMQMSTGIYFCYFITNFYEIAQASGFLCITSGAYFLISSNVIGDGKIKYWRIMLSSFCLSMGVLCRPTLALYCIAALLFIYAGVKKMKVSNKDNKTLGKKHYISYLLYSLVPFVIVGLVQIIYNYIRFGNPMEFGIQYSLTINDFTSSQYHTHFVFIGLFNYLLTLPEFSEAFPFFVAGNAKTFNPQGYYFLATGGVLGLLWRAFPILAYGKSICAYRNSYNKNKRLYAIIFAFVCVICPLIIIFSTWESGYGTRYCVDFAWQIILGALIICFIIYNRCSKSLQKHLNKLMICSFILSFVMNFIQIYSYINPVQKFSLDWQSNVLSFARLFEFWR